jgi:outer membrane immunogenic protein
MKGILFASLAMMILAVAIQTVTAAESRAVMSSADNLTGFYLGVQGGGGWGRSRQTDTNGTTSGSYSVGGGLAGGTLGFNWQIGPAGLLGAETDVSWADMDGSTRPAVCAGSCFSELQWLGTVRPRLGVAILGRFVPYLTGGFAFGDIRAGQSGINSFTHTKLRTGWTVGGGLEAMIASNWSIKGEYLFVDLGNSENYKVTIPVKVDYHTSLLRLGVNYRF